METIDPPEPERDSEGEYWREKESQNIYQYNYGSYQSRKEQHSYHKGTQRGK